MEEEVIPEQQNELPQIYSKGAIRVFATFFSAIFGGVLVMQNLKDIGKKKEANIALIFSILYTIVVIILGQFIHIISASSFSFLFGVLGAIILTEVFYNKYIPNEKEYPKKKIWKPLIIAIIIITPLVVAILLDTPKS